MESQGIQEFQEVYRTCIPWNPRIPWNAWTPSNSMDSSELQRPPRIQCYSMESQGIQWIPWNSVGSMEFHGTHGICGISWNVCNCLYSVGLKMESMELNRFHGLQSNPWNSMNSMKLHVDCKNSMDFQGIHGNPRIPLICVDAIR